MAKDPDLSEKHSHNVELRHADLGDLGTGTLQFGASQWPSVSLGYSTKLGEGQKLGLIKATSSSGQIFSLFDCTYKGFSLFVDYVIFGELDAPSFTRIDIRFSNISEWFLNHQRITGTLGEELTWKNNSKPLSVEVKTGNRQFTINSNYEASFQKQGEDHVLHEHIEFSVESTKGNFKLIDLKHKAHDLSCLLSLLIAYPISTLSVHIVAKGGDRQLVYYPGIATAKQDASDNDLWTQFFIKKAAIEDRWQKIFENYYRSKYRNVIWVRLAGMLGYKGFWEYRTLGYVSLLDQYTTQFSERTEKRATPVLDPKILSELTKAIDLIVPPVDASERSELKKAIRRVSKDLTEWKSFPKRYLLTLQQTDHEILSIINLTDDDFDFVKDVRDRIAHGEDHGIKSNDFTRSETIVSKIALLLTYWAFMDFGLTKGDFIRCLTTTHSRLLLKAQPDRVQLARVTQPEIFFKVSTSKLVELKQIAHIRDRPCFIRSKADGLCFSTELTQKYKTMTGAASLSPVPPDTEIFGVPADQIRFLVTAYIESSSDRLELHLMHIIEGVSIEAEQEST